MRLDGEAYKLVGSLIAVVSRSSEPDAEPLGLCLYQAESVIGIGYSPRQRANLIKAVKLNLSNRKQYSFEFLQRRFQLPLSINTFAKEKRAYVARVCEQLPLIGYNPVIKKKSGR